MSKNTKDVLIIVGISLLVILAIVGFLIYKNKGKEEVVPASGNSISNDKIETQENILTETEQENIEKETEEKEDEKTEEKEKEEVVNKKPNNTNKDTVTNTNKDTTTNTNKDNNSSNNQNSTSGETTNTVKQLGKPSNIKWSESEVGLVTWSKVENATGYITETFKDGKSIGAGAGPGTSCSIKALIKEFGAGTYTVKIKAESNILPSSEFAETTYTAKQLGKPSNIKWSESEVGLVTWSPVQYATGYIAEIFKDGKSIGAGAAPETSCSIKALIKEFGAGTYTVKIKAESNILPPSEFAETTYTAKQLGKPSNIKWSESEVGLVTWSPVQYATGYFAEIFKDGKSIGAGAAPETSCSIKALIKEFGAGTYTITIQAESDILPASDKVTTTYTK